MTIKIGDVTPKIGDTISKIGDNNIKNKKKQYFACDINYFLYLCNV